ncbi:MAG: hypothetical protein QXS76_00195 [Candidatus Bathyarchaeia archaeon]
MARRRKRDEEMREERQDAIVGLFLSALAGIFWIAISTKALGKLVGLGMLATTAISALLLRRKGII